MCSCLASNAKHGQSFPLELGQLQSTHIILKWSEQRQRMNSFYTVIKRASDADHCAVFPSTFINEISVILDKHRTKHYYVHDIIMMRKTRHLSNDIDQRYSSSIIPTHSEATSTQVHHFNVYSPAFRDVHSTVGFRWCL